MHKTRTICILSTIFLVLLQSFQLLPWQELSKCTITNLNRNFSNNTIFPLTVACTVQKQDSFKYCFFFFGNEAPNFLVIVFDQVNQVFKRQLRVTDDELSIILI